MNLSKPTISFFCPAYNDEENLPILIPQVIEVLKKNTSKFEIVIVEDGSPDNTGKVADSLQKKYPKLISVIHHKKNMGYGATLRDGFSRASKYDFVMYTDGDNQYHASDIKKLIAPLKKYDVVLGYRLNRFLSQKRLIQTNVCNMLVRLLFNVHAKDINCSMKIFRKDIVKKMKLASNSSFIDAEMIISLKRQNIKFTEVGVRHYPREFGQASGGKMSVILDTVKDMIYCLRHS